MISDPIRRINICKTLDELKTVWTENIDDWKHRLDFKALSRAKDDAKARLSWHQTMADMMLRYNELVDAMETATTRESAEAIVAEGEQIEKDLFNLAKRIIDEKWPINKDGLRFLKIYGIWLNDNNMMKMEGLNGKPE